jgi:hypothetical protein
MMANLGQLSLTTTTVANAADSSALALGSQLATKARYLAETLGENGQTEVEKCKKRGFLGMLLAIVATVIIIIIVIISCLVGCPGVPLLAAIPAVFGTATLTAAAAVQVALGLAIVGAASGAAFGAMGGAIAGTGAARGALQGAGVGAAIGAAVGTAGAAGKGFAGLAGAEILAAGEGAAVGSSGTIPALGSIPTGASVIGGSTLAAPAAIAAGAASVGSSVYVGVVKDLMTADAFAAASNALSGLPEYDQIREGIFLQALSQTVSDPNRTDGTCHWPKLNDEDFIYSVSGDPDDSDGDGNRSEQIPCFQYWWDQRIRQLSRVSPQLSAETQSFVNGPWATFERAAQAATSSGGTLARRDMEGADGPVVELARFFTDRGQQFEFWKPGPGASELNNWETSECSTCEAPGGYDELDLAVDTLKDAVELGEAVAANPLASLVSTWQSWSEWTNDPDDRDSLNGTLGVVVQGGSGVKGMKKWMEELDAVKRNLPQCQYAAPVWDPGDHASGLNLFEAFASFLLGADAFAESDSYCGNFPWDPICNPPGGGGGQPGGGGPPVGLPGIFGGQILNAPCQDAAHNFATIDADYDDEFAIAQSRLGTLIGQIETFRNEATAYHRRMQAIYAQIGTTFGTYGNSVTYTSKDSQGPHAVMVETGNFKLPQIKSEKRGGFLKGKVCMVLKNYRDEGKNSWVRITRQDPPKDLGLWGWNAFGSGLERGVVSRKACASYSFDQVGLTACPR